MPSIYLERVPIKNFYLGYFGFDHLQLVFEPDSLTSAPVPQEGWFVLEGTRSVTPNGVFLGALGDTGSMTLYIATGGLRGEALEASIGTPETRGSRLVTSTDATAAWAAMVQHAQDIADHAYRYVGYGLPSSPTSTLNSTSFITSVMYVAGFEITDHLPRGLRFSPGTNTLLGGYDDERFQIAEHYDALYGGFGEDVLFASDSSNRVDRLYGGGDNDELHWSADVDYMHGGDPSLSYAEDGTDSLVFEGAGIVTFEFFEHNVPHRTPEFVAAYNNGIAWLFSIEIIKWNENSDVLIAGPGVQLTDEPVSLHLGGQDAGRGDELSLDGAGAGMTINGATSTAHFINANGATGDAGLWVESVEWLIGSAHDDRFYAGDTLRGIEAGAGNDLIDVHEIAAHTGHSPRGFDIEIDGGDGNDTIVASAGRTLANGGAGADRFVVSALTTPGQGTVELVIEGADANDSLFIAYNLINGSGAGYDGSSLMQITGAVGTIGELMGDLFQLSFQHRTMNQIHFGHNEPQGNILLLGYIGFYMEGDDLIVLIMSGEAITETVEIDDAGNTRVETHIGSDPATSTYIRIVDFQPGDLGLQFIDPGEPYFDEGLGVTIYPDWDSAVSQLYRPFSSPLEARPAAPTSDPNSLDNAPTPPPTRFDGTPGDDQISLDQPARVQAGAGDDTITMSGAGNDTIDGGEGADSMSGGDGNDTYIVDNAGDLVIEASGGGNDVVISSIDLVLADHVEDLYLAGAARAGTGNDLRNRLVGSDGDDTLSGLGGGDTLLGGRGDDVLIGGDGRDGYMYFRGDGHERIVDGGTTQGEPDIDTLYLFDGISPADVTFFRLASSPDDLMLAIRGGGRITIENYFTGDGSGIDVIRFENGVVWNRDEIDDRADDAPILTAAPPDAHDDPVLHYGGSDYIVPAALLLANDRAAAGATISIVAVSELSAGSAFVNAQGDIQLVMPPGYEGLLTFTYTIMDADGGTSSARAAMTIVENEAPVATAIIPHQTVAAGQSWSMALPAGLFTDADGDRVYVWATLANGDSLPAWLRFDGRTGTFSGTPPEGASGDLDIRLVAADDYTRSHLDFTLSIGAGGEPGVTVQGTPDNEELVGGAGNDVFLLAAQSNGFDTYNGGGGIDTILGNPWNDVIGIWSITSIEVIDLGAGDDIIRLTEGGATLDLSGVTLIGVELIDGGAGNDTITGSSGHDVIRGNAGDDTLIGGGGNDTFTIVGGAEGFDHFDGGSGIDTILGSAWNDVIGIASLANVEIIDAGAGNDTIRLTAGNDTLDLSGVTLIGVELIDGGTGNDTITGSSGHDVIRGNAGDDTLIGGGGNDTFTIVGGAEGFDHFDGGSGTDTILGSAWNDVIGIASLANVEIIDAGAGNDTIRLTGGNDTLDLSGVTLIGVELIDGGTGNDTITGSSGHDIIRGNAGDDTLIGGGGNDTFTIVGGAEGFDHFDGGSGTDTILGSAWN
ncbi:MAG: putative Ig domain-containing protein, partial [Hyphomicrobiaceae bacterium]